MNKQRILITGAAGFIGSHLARHLIKQGHELILVDDFSRGKVKDIEGQFIYKVDLRDPSKGHELFGLGIDTVVHLASRVGGVFYYKNNPLEVLRDNFLIDNRVLELATRHKVKNYIYASSSHMYPFTLFTHRDVQPVPEYLDYPYNPYLSYGWSKLMGEKMIDFLSENEMKTVILRFIGIYGPGQDSKLETGSVIPVLTRRAIEYPDTPFTVYGNGTEERSYCYVEDLFSLFDTILDKLGKTHIRNHGPFNVGKQEKISIKEIAEKIVNISGKKIKIKYEPRETDLQCQWCSCEKVKNTLGWQATTSIDRGLVKVYKSMEKQCVS